MKLSANGITIELVDGSREVHVVVLNDDGDLIANFVLSLGDASAFEKMLRFVNLNSGY